MPIRCNKHNGQGSSCKSICSANAIRSKKPSPNASIALRILIALATLNGSIMTALESVFKCARTRQKALFFEYRNGAYTQYVSSVTQKNK